MVYKADTIETPKLHYEKGIYLHPLHEDLNLFYHHQLHEFMIQYTVKPITWTSPPWPHNQPLHKEPVKCDHPRMWNKHSKEAQRIQEITGERGYELGYEEHIRPAITGILDQMRRARQLLLKEEKNSQEIIDPEVIEFKSCLDCECLDCYQQGLCGLGCENPRKQCQNIMKEV